MTDFNAIWAKLQALDTRWNISSDSFENVSIHVKNGNGAPNTPSAVYDTGGMALLVTEHLSPANQEVVTIHEVKVTDNASVYLEGDWTGKAWTNRAKCENTVADPTAPTDSQGNVIGGTHISSINQGHFTEVMDGSGRGNRGVTDLFWGGDGDDVLDGKTGNDTLHGGGGRDVLYGGEGNDYLYGDGGIDFLFGGNGNDYMDGGADDDHLEGGIGNDTLLGGAGDDELMGGADADNLDGGIGNDVLYGEGGDDILFGNAGSDSMYGGADNDTYMFTTGCGLDFAAEGANQGAMDMAYITNATSVAVLKSGNDLILALNNQDMLVLHDWYANVTAGDAGGGVDYAYFAANDALYSTADLATLAQDMGTTNSLVLDGGPTWTMSDLSVLETVPVDVAGVGAMVHDASVAFAQ